MKTLKIIGVGLAILFALHWFRYRYEFGGYGDLTLYRHDRLLGETCYSVGNSPWRPL